MRSAQAQPLKVGAWDDDIRHTLVVVRVKAVGRADLVFARADSAFYGYFGICQKIFSGESLFMASSAALLGELPLAPHGCPSQRGSASPHCAIRALGRGANGALEIP